MESEQLIIFRRCKSHVYNKIMDMLAELTGIEWGHVARDTSVMYLTSNEIPLKVGINYARRYQKQKAPILDIEITNKSPRIFDSEDTWSIHVLFELQSKLLDHQLLNDHKYNAIKGKLLLYQPQGELAECILESKEQWEKYPDISADIKPSKIFNKWLDDCC